MRAPKVITVSSNCSALVARSSSLGASPYLNSSTTTLWGGRSTTRSLPSFFAPLKETIFILLGFSNVLISVSFSMSVFDPALIAIWCQLSCCESWFFIRIQIDERNMYVTCRRIQWSGNVHSRDRSSIYFVIGWIKIYGQPFSILVHFYTNQIHDR